MTADIRTLDGGEGLAYELRLDIPAATAWALWTDPNELVRWMGSKATLEPRPGGAFRLEYGTGDVAAGSYLHVDEPRALGYTWGWEAEADFPPGSSTIEIELESTAASVTTLRLRHTGMPAELLGNVDDGWRWFLGRLAEVAAGGEVAAT